MTVVKGERTDSKLRVVLNAKELAVRTMSMCRNEKYFPRRSRWMLAPKIIDLALDVYSCCRGANSIRVTRSDNVAFSKRREYQLQAHSSLDALLGLIELAHYEFSIPNEKIELWVETVDQVLKLLDPWMRRDVSRFKSDSLSSRTPYPSNSNNVRNVNRDGSLNNNNANNNNGVCADCDENGQTVVGEQPNPVPNHKERITLSDDKSDEYETMTE